MKALRGLSLGATRVTDEGVAVLAGMPSLEWVDLYHTEFR
jgi:hypothetical protein